MIRAIDNHAHSISADYLKVSPEKEFFAFLTESSQPRMKEMACRSLNAELLKAELYRSFNVSNFDEYMALRAGSAHAHLNQLFDLAGLDTLLIDDGFSRGFLDLAAFSSICGNRRIFRVFRLEALFEEAIKGEDTLVDCLALVKARLSHLCKSEIKTVALKSVLAYRGGLSLSTKLAELESFDDLASLSEAEYAKFRGSLLKSGRIDSSLAPLYLLLLAEAFRFARAEQLPVQIHCGLGDDDALLEESNPLRLQPFIRALSRLAKLPKLVLLHTFPYVKEAAYLASMYEEIYFDLSLCSFLAAPALAQGIKEALAMSPYEKLLAGSDGHSQPESHFWGMFNYRSALGEALQGCQASLREKITELVLCQNASLLYRI
jgi:hypothetical protein